MRQVLVPHDLPPLILLRAPGASIVSLDGKTMGTTWSVRFVESAHVSLELLRRVIEGILDGVVREMSPWIPDSDISRYNNAPAGTWCVLPPDFLTVLRCALSVADLSGGAYDPAVGALIDLWGFGPHGCPHVPDVAAIAAAREQCGWKRIKLDGAHLLQPGGVRLDFSSIAKGFTVDKISTRLASLGVADHLVEIGGELTGHGTKPDGSPWWVALERCDGDVAQARETIVALHGWAIATSGDSQRFFEHNGARVSHTIDPRTGYPASNIVASVAVLHRSCMCADAWATAFAALGPDEGHGLAVDLNLAARFVLRERSGIAEKLTPRMSAMLN